MNRRLRRSSPAISLSPAEQRFLRYLKPGALAQLRDSKISARSHLRSANSSSHLHLHQIATSPPPSPSQIDACPCFFPGRIHGLRFPQRKRLVASRPPAFFSPSGSPALSPPEPVIDLFGSSNDMLVAH